MLFRSARPGQIVGVDLHVIRNGMERELLRHATQTLQHCLWVLPWRGPTRLTFAQFAQCVRQTYDIQSGDPRVREVHQVLMDLHDGLACAVRAGVPFEVSAAGLPAWHAEFAPLAAYAGDVELEAAA